MNTKMKQIALPLIVVIAVMLAFSSPAAADYGGDHPLVTYEHGMLNDGGIVYETVEDASAYMKLNCTYYPDDPTDSLTQDISITIPAGATVKMARLYNYYTWSNSDWDNKYVPGVPAEATMWFTNPNSDTVMKECIHGYNDSQRDIVPNPIYYGSDAVQYWDSKGQGYTGYKKYDYPSGTFAWDVTDMVTGSGTYTAKITNNDSTPTGIRPQIDPINPAYRERFATFGFGLLVVYDEYKPGASRKEYWIDEGCDYLTNRTKTAASAPHITYAPFNGSIKGGNLEATLTTVVTASDRGNWVPPQNMVSFNGNWIGPSTAYNYWAIGVDSFDVTANLVKKDNNYADFQDRGDCEVVSNAFLVVETK